MTSCLVRRMLRLPQVQQQVMAKRKDLAGRVNLGLFEVICGGDLERPIHYSEKVNF